MKIKDRNRSQTLRHGSSNFYKEKLILTYKICPNMYSFPHLSYKRIVIIFWRINKKTQYCSPPASHILICYSWLTGKVIVSSSWPWRGTSWSCGPRSPWLCPSPLGRPPATTRTGTDRSSSPASSSSPAGLTRLEIFQLYSPRTGKYFVINE